MKKLTLSARESTIATAKRLAAENGTTISAMFERMIVLLDSKQNSRKAKLGPMTRNASGLIELAGDANGREVLEEALLERFGSTK